MEKAPGESFAGVFTSAQAKGEEPVLDSAGALSRVPKDRDRGWDQKPESRCRLQGPADNRQHKHHRANRGRDHWHLQKAEPKQKQRDAADQEPDRQPMSLGLNAADQALAQQLCIDAAIKRHR